MVFWIGETNHTASVICMKFRKSIFIKKKKNYAKLQEKGNAKTG